jgi:hypothetical protein
MTVILVTDKTVPISCKGMTNEDWIVFTQKQADQLENKITEQNELDDKQKAADKARYEVIVAAWQEYHEATAPALSEFNKEIAPATKKFEEKTALARKAYDEALKIND